MRIILCSLAISLSLCLLIPYSLSAEDMRELQLQARQARDALIRKAALEKAGAMQAATASREQIRSDRQSLEREISALEREKAGLKSAITTLERQHLQLRQTEALLTEELSQTDQMIRELVGTIRTNAKDIDAMIANNLQSTVNGAQTGFFTAIGADARFPGMEDVHALAGALLDLVETTGEVSRTTAPIVDRSGATTLAELLVIGPFSASYRLGKETGFLTHSASGNKLFALSRLPPRRMQKQIKAYVEGSSAFVPMDITRGGALQQLSYSLSLWEQVRKGGPIVWPILALLIAGLIIIAERFSFLLRHRFDSEGFIRRIGHAVEEDDWQTCDAICSKIQAKPVARVVEAGLQCRHMEREEMENALQEAILGEIPSMERFLSTLGILAAIAPLLGLLGTVTGMIDTFHIITLYGTGDPRLMSGGISEALVTTMLGLSVAIPLMLAHTLLSRSVEREIGLMEEKAIALVNIVHKSRV